MREGKKPRTAEAGVNKSGSGGAGENEAPSGENKCWVYTTIQGAEATFVKIGTHTTLFFGGFEEPSEIKEAEFLASYGSQDPDFVGGLLAQLANVSPQVRQVSVKGYDEAPDVQALRSLAAGVRALAPRDPLDATICAEMVVAHALSMMFADELSRSVICQELESAELSSTRLLRTYSALSEALERHRTCRDWKIAGQQVTTGAAGANGKVLTTEGQTSLRLESNGRKAKLVGTLGTGHGLNDPHFVSSLFGPLTRLGTRSGFALDPSLAFARAFVTGMAPQDAHEAQISAQMAVAHSYAMYFANRLTQAEDWSDMASAERSLCRFLRTFCAQTEAFDRHRMRCSRRRAARQPSIAGFQAVLGDTHHQNDAIAIGEVNGHAPA